MIGSLIRVRWLTWATVRPACPRASASAAPTRTPRLHCSTELHAAHAACRRVMARLITAMPAAELTKSGPWSIQPWRRSRPGGADPAGRGSARSSIDHGPDLSLGRLEAEESDRPGQAGLLPRPVVGIRGKLGDQVERAAAGPCVADLAGQFGQRLRAWQADGE